MPQNNYYLNRSLSDISRSSSYLSLPETTTHAQPNHAQPNSRFRSRYHSDTGLAQRVQEGSRRPPSILTQQSYTAPGVLPVNIEEESDVFSNDVPSSPRSDTGEFRSSPELLRSTNVTDKTPDPSSFRNWTKTQWLTLVTQCILIFLSTVAYSLLSPFFPQEAKEKGVSTFVTGLIFGVYELVNFIVAPLYGNLVTQLGPKFMSVSGSFLAGGCCILFGTLQQCPDGWVFITMCFVIRVVEANGSSMQMVSGTAILSEAFPHNVATINGLAEGVSGVGYMVGPFVGALLYQTGGYFLPFAVVGTSFLIGTFIALFLLPSYSSSNVEKRGGLGFIKLLKNPGITILYIHMLLATIALTFLEPILSPWLQKNFSISVTMVGIIFLIWSAVYTICAPAVGKLNDMGHVYNLMISGGVICTLSLLLMGPSPLLKDIFGKQQLWVVILTCVGLGLSCAMMFIPPFMACIHLVILDGYEMNTQLYGLVGGLMFSASSLGAFAGPTIAGILYDSIGFEWSITVCGFSVLAGVTLTLIYVIVMKCLGRKIQPDKKKFSSEDCSTEASNIQNKPDEKTPLLA